MTRSLHLPCRFVERFRSALLGIEQARRGAALSVSYGCPCFFSSWRSTFCTSWGSCFTAGVPENLQREENLQLVSQAVSACFTCSHAAVQDGIARLRLYNPRVRGFPCRVWPGSLCGTVLFLLTALQESCSCLQSSILTLRRGRRAEALIFPGASAIPKGPASRLVSVCSSAMLAEKVLTFRLKKGGRDVSRAG